MFTPITYITVITYDAYDNLYRCGWWQVDHARLREPGAVDDGLHVPF